MIDIHETRMTAKDKKRIEVGNLYVVATLYSKSLQFAVCLGFTQQNEPYFYGFGALLGMYAPDGNGYIARIDNGYLKAMYEPIKNFEFNKVADKNSFFDFKKNRLFDLSLGKLTDIDLSLWYTKQRLLYDNLPALKRQQKELKPVSKKDLVTNTVYVITYSTGSDCFGFAIYTGNDNDYFNFIELESAYQIQEFMKFPNRAYVRQLKSKPKFYRFEDVKECLTEEQIKNYNTLNEFLSNGETNVLYR